MSNCTHCGAVVAPNSRFCTECGRPLAAAGQAPVPPAPPVGAVPPVPPAYGQPPLPPAQNGAMPPRPAMPPMAPTPMSQPMGTPPVPPPGIAGRPPVPPAPGMQPYTAPAPQPAAPPAPPAYGMQPPAPPTPAAPPVAPAQVAAAAAPAPAPAPVTGNAHALVTATTGDLFNNGNPVAVIVTGTQLVLLANNGQPVLVENVPGVRHAVIGDWDGDGTSDLALFTDTHVWIVRYNQMGGVHSGKVALQEVPEHLVRAPFTHDGRAVLMATTREKVTFHVLHPSRGLVEIASAPVPAIEP